MKITCPACQALVPGGQLNVGADVAVCANCNEAFAISGVLAGGQGLDDFDIYNPPHGVRFEETGTGWRIVATTRSAGAFFLVPFMCVWSGFSLGGIYGTQIVKGEFNLGMSLFGIPFVLGTLMLGAMAMMTVCGKVVVSVDRDVGRVFVGAGPIGWTRDFDWPAITAVEEDVSGLRQSESNGQVIALIGQTRLKFGGMLSDPRRFYILQALRKQLALRQAKY